MSNQARVTAEDTGRWVRQGLISQRQADSILAAEGLLEKGPVIERAEGLSPITVAYYFGSFLALFAYTIFVGQQWEKLTTWQQFGVCLVSLLIIGGLGILLRSRTRYPVAGGLLIFVAAGILPLLFYTVEKALGIWPVGEEPSAGSSAFYSFWRHIRVAWIYLDIASIVGAGLVLLVTRFPLISLLVANFIWFLSLDITRLVGNPQEWFSREQVLMTLAICGPIGIQAPCSLFRPTSSGSW